MTEEAKRAYEKIDHTLCLNQNEGFLQFGLDTEEHIDCKDAWEMTYCLDTLFVELEKATEREVSDEVMSALEELKSITPTHVEYSRDEDLNGDWVYDTTEVEDNPLGEDYGYLFAIIESALLVKSKKEKAFDTIIVKNPLEAGIAVNYVKTNINYTGMLTYEKYCMTIREADRLSEENFNSLVEVMKNGVI